MSKLPSENKFLDFSDYGRKPGRWIALQLKFTKINAVQVTLSFFICGLIAVYAIYSGYYFLAGVCLILKSILDAADGELARIKKTPSYIGRYLDSVLDLILNFIVLYAIYSVTKIDLAIMIICFLAFQIQGTVYNYYYLIVRKNIRGSDKTSRINENSFPIALHGENQTSVNVLFILYLFFYRGFDLLVIFLDSKAQNIQKFPNWFLSLISIYGLGFQLLIISIMLSFKLTEFIIPFFISYSIFIPIIIFLRKFSIK